MLSSPMARRPVSKELWQQLQPLIPAFVPSSKGGPRRRTVSDEAALPGILFVLQTGIPWEDLPQSMGFGSGMTPDGHPKLLHLWPVKLLQAERCRL